MRLFVAIGADELSFDPKVAFKKLRINLERKNIEHRWVPAENYHVTLSFLGEVAEENVPALTEKLSELAGHHEAFDLRIDGVGAFPKERMGRVIWIGVRNSIPLRDLAAHCHKAMVELGLVSEERELSFSPHITVARLRSPKNLKDILSPVENLEFGNWSVRRLTLFESKTGGAFPIYEAKGHFPLNPLA